MVNRLIRYETGANGIVDITVDTGKVLVGDTFPPTTSQDMYGVACDASGFLYVSDSERGAIYKVKDGGEISLFAGTPNEEGYVNAGGTDARFSSPLGMAVDKSGNIYVADIGNGAIRKIDQGARVSTLADGFVGPWDVAVAPNGNVIVADTADNKVYSVEPNGTIHFIAGDDADDVCGVDVDGAKIKGNEAKFNAPATVAVDPSGNIYVGDTGNYKIKKIDTDGWVTRFCGTGSEGNVNGDADTSEFTNIFQLRSNKTGELYMVDKVARGVTRLKRIDGNGNTATAAYIDEDALGFAIAPNGQIFVAESAGQIGNVSSASSESSQGSSDSSGSSPGP